MKVTADEDKRVVLPSAKPGESFELQMPVAGTFVLTRLEAVPSRPASVRIEKRGAFTVGVLDQAIDARDLQQALAEFP